MSEADVGMLAAVIMGERKGIQKWLDRGASLQAVNKRGETALMLSNNIETLRWLIGEGVPVDARDASGHTALFRAATWHKPEVVRLFLEFGANVHVRDAGGRTPLIAAAWPWPYDSEAIETFDVLLNAGVDINAVDQCGKTALIHLLEDEQHDVGHLDVVRLFIDHGVDIRIVDRDGKAALDYSNDRGFMDVSRFIEEQTIGKS